ncbi:MAG: ribbon-helix-helix protein, CopG family [Caldilineaceae bacterium]|nr:ribbon-helix-helix protein, CopG family [Caldilineaceae bacterium]
MKTIQITIDEMLLADVDQVVQEQGANRSAFIRDALHLALQRWRIQQLEAQHATGYRRRPAAPGEFDGWEEEQLWGDA